MSFVQAGTYAGLVLCLAGLLWRMRRWSRPKSALHVSGAQGGRKQNPGRLLLVFLRDVLLLARTGNKSPYRWLAHGLILAGFAYLLVFHALGGFFIAPLVDNFQPTGDPWRFLRNLAGAMVLLGLVMALLRRLKDRRLRGLSRFQDWFLLLLLTGIMLSGFMLEAGKIISPAVFERMTKEYMVSGETRDLAALKAYWAREQGAVFAKPPASVPQALRAGAEIAARNCLHCHGKTGNAFVSRQIARGLAGLAGWLDQSGTRRALYYLHVILCLLGLACLPWGKLIHPLATPLWLMQRPVEGREENRPAPILPALDACTRCGECSLHCSVAPAFCVLGIREILPSEKLVSADRLAKGSLDRGGVPAFGQGQPHLHGLPPLQ